MNQSHAPGSQRRKSMRSCYRNIPGARDKGQRYAVTYLDGMLQRREFGFTNDAREARRWVKKIDENPVWSEPKIEDRQA